MKYYLVKAEHDENVIAKVGASGFVPKNVVATVPDELAQEDERALEIVDGQVVLNTVKKQALIDAFNAAKAAQAQEKAKLRQDIAKIRTSQDMQELKAGLDALLKHLGM